MQLRPRLEKETEMDSGGPRSELVESLAAMAIGLGLVTLVLFPLALPLVILTIAATLPLLVPIALLGVLAGIFWGVWLAMRAAGRGLGRLRRGHGQSGGGLGANRNGGPTAASTAPRVTLRRAD
jgi:hypothetical protein